MNQITGHGEVRAAPYNSYQSSLNAKLNSLLSFLSFWLSVGVFVDELIVRVADTHRMVSVGCVTTLLRERRNND